MMHRQVHLINRAICYSTRSETVHFGRYSTSVNFRAHFSIVRYFPLHIVHRCLPYRKYVGYQEYMGAIVVALVPSFKGCRDRT